MVGKATPDRGDPRKSPGGVDPKTSGWASKRIRKTQRDGHNSGVKIWSLCSVSSTLSHANPWTTLSNPCNKVRGKNIVKEVFLCLYPASFLPVSSYWVFLRASLLLSRYDTVNEYITYGHLPPITKTIQVRRTGHAGHCWRSRDELIRDVLLWTPIYGRTKAGRPARTYIQQLCEDTECSPEDLPEAMNDREKWRERVRDIPSSGTTWWWWWWSLASLFM